MSGPILETLLCVVIDVGKIRSGIAWDNHSTLVESSPYGFPSCGILFLEKYVQSCHGKGPRARHINSGYYTW